MYKELTANVYSVLLENICLVLDQSKVCTQVKM